MKRDMCVGGGGGNILTFLLSLFCDSLPMTFIVLWKRSPNTSTHRLMANPSSSPAYWRCGRYVSWDMCAWERWNGMELPIEKNSNLLWTKRTWEKSTYKLRREEKRHSDPCCGILWVYWSLHCGVQGAVYFLVDLTRLLTIPHSLYFIGDFSLSYSSSVTSLSLSLSLIFFCSLDFLIYTFHFPSDVYCHRGVVIPWRTAARRWRWDTLTHNTVQIRREKRWRREKGETERGECFSATPNDASFRFFAVLLIDELWDNGKTLLTIKNELVRKKRGSLVREQRLRKVGEE